MLEKQKLLVEKAQDFFLALADWVEEAKKEQPPVIGKCERGPTIEFVNVIDPSEIEIRFDGVGVTKAKLEILLPSGELYVDAGEFEPTSNTPRIKLLKPLVTGSYVAAMLGVSCSGYSIKSFEFVQTLPGDGDTKECVETGKILSIELINDDEL